MAWSDDVIMPLPLVMLSVNSVHVVSGGQSARARSEQNGEFSRGEVLPIEWQTVRDYAWNVVDCCVKTSWPVSLKN